MLKSTHSLAYLLEALTGSARHAGWTDAEWARRSGLPKETLCRLRSRSSCDLATLHALSQAVGKRLTVDEPAARTSADGLWPAVVDRPLESKLLDVLSTRSSRAEDWRPLGPSFFLAGLAVTLSSVPGFDRHRFLDLAETLHPGATEPRVFAKWLAETPLPPARFLPMLQARSNDTA
jgi:DNA-binding phage protein